MPERQDLEDRIKRAGSWIEAAGQLRRQDHHRHAEFVTLYVAFNSLYGRRQYEGTASQVHEDLERFLDRLKLLRQKDEAARGATLSKASCLPGRMSEIVGFPVSSRRLLEAACRSRNHPSKVCRRRPESERGTWRGAIRGFSAAFAAASDGPQGSSSPRVCHLRAEFTGIRRPDGWSRDPACAGAGVSAACRGARRRASGKRAPVGSTPVSTHRVEETSAFRSGELTARVMIAGGRDQERSGSVRRVAKIASRENIRQQTEQPRLGQGARHLARTTFVEGVKRRRRRERTTSADDKLRLFLEGALRATGKR